VDKAEDTYKRMIAIQPRDGLGYSYLGTFYFGQAQYEKAQAMFEKAIALTFGDYHNYSNLCAVLLYEGKYQDAVATCEKSTAIRPSADAYANAADALFLLHRFPDAIQQNLAALKLSNNDYEIWEVLADSYFYSGNTPLAIEAYKKALSLAEPQLKLNQRDSGVLASLSYYQAMLGNRKESLSLLDRALEVNHSDKELLFKAAEVYNQLRETGPTLEFLNKAFVAGYSRSLVSATASFDNLHGNPRFQAMMQQK
jgi:Flp pilus assembly protein TadD